MSPSFIDLGRYNAMFCVSVHDDCTVIPNTCRAKAKKCGMRPVVPPKSNRKKPWRYDKKLYKRRNIVERNCRNIKQFRRVFTRYDKLDETYNASIAFASITICWKNEYKHNIVKMIRKKQAVCVIKNLLASHRRCDKMAVWSVL